MKNNNQNHLCPTKALDSGLKPNSNGHPITPRLSVGLKNEAQDWRASARIIQPVKKLFGILIIFTLAASLHSCHHHGDAGETLALNNGKKWNADDVTAANVAALQNVLTEFSAKNETGLDAYRGAAQQLQQAANKLISDCRMKGPDHEALHLWLVPLLDQIKNLKNAADEKQAAEVYGQIENQMKQFNNFFE